MKLIIAITGASGAIYAKILLDELVKLQDQVNEIAVVLSKTAVKVWEFELEDNSYKNSLWKKYEPDDFYAPFASGSSDFDAMIIIPCTMGTMGKIANGVADDLIARAADVMLKERRKLIIVPRETPYNLIHINNMKTLTEAGAIICPATPSFYSKPKDIQDLVKTVTDRVLQLTGLYTKGYRWGYDE